MATYFLKWLRFKVERLLLRGTSSRLLFIVCVIGLVCLVGGTMAFNVAAGQFDSWADAVWWAFLRLTDPGYLGDDKGLALRTVSTVVTMLGYVLFMGSLIAIMVQWLDSTVQRLERGRSPVFVRNHVLVLGWTNRTPIIIRELLQSEGRMRRFLKRHNAQRLRIVILAEQLTAGLRQDLRDFLGPLWSEHQIIFRSGTPLRQDHLARAAFMDSSAIIVPGTDFSPEGIDLADAATLKVLLALNRLCLCSEGAMPHGEGRAKQRLPYLSTEVGDVRRAGVVRGAYSGPVEVIASDSIVSLLLGQILRHPGLSQVYNELLTSQGETDVYVRSCPELEGERIQDVGVCFPNAVVVGVVAEEETGHVPVLNPPDGTRIQPGAKLVLLAGGFEDTQPMERPLPLSRRATSMIHSSVRRFRVLLMGWNERLPLLLEEFGWNGGDVYDVDVLSAFPAATRQAKIDRYGPVPDNVAVHHVEGDYAVPGDLSVLQLPEYDCIMILGCDWLPDKNQADARSILGYRVLDACLGRTPKRPRVVLELLAPDNEALVELADGEELLLSPLILGYVQAHVGLRPELNSVLHQLFSTGGPDILFRRVAEYGISGVVPFGGIADTVLAVGDTALGIRKQGNSDGRELVMAPDRDSMWELVDDDELVVLGNRH